MTGEEIQALLDAQRAFFNSRATLSVDFRIKSLRKLYDAVKAHEGDIHAALTADLGKSAYEGFMCESGLALTEISYMIKHTRKLARRKTVRTPLAQFASHSFTQAMPYGNTLVMSPWNYPFLLTIDPLADAIAAGNTVILKPSAYSPATSAIIERIVAECFAPEHVAVVTGGRAENTALLEQKFDFIFFTGSQNVGKEVLRHAAEFLTPAVLELGGKSPCIVDATANLKVAARRIAFGKWLNVGQTCVAPDYLLVDTRVHDELLGLIKEETRRMFGEHPLDNEDYGRIVNAKHFVRVRGLIDPDKVVLGGAAREASLKIEPTILDCVAPDDAVMQEEVFGPILPVLTFESLDEAETFITDRPTPLALYIFSQDRAVQERFVRYVPFGGGCVNDTIMHLATSHMGFGGMGASGMGQYHGRESFDTFSHKKSIVNKVTWLDVPFRYAPYASWKHKFVRMFVH